MELTNWRDCFPYEEPRWFQEQLLDLLAKHINHYDVFVITAPTAFGKTAIAKTLMECLYSVSYCLPNNMLVDQMLREFPDTRSLRRLDSYKCETLRQPCASTRSQKKVFCKGCPASSDLATAKYRKGPGVYNYHIFTAHKLYRDHLIFDEAHNLVPWLMERHAKIIWHHDTKYNPRDLVGWVNSLPPSKLKKGSKLWLLKEALTSEAPDYQVQETEEEFNGKGTKRGEPETRRCLKLLPVNVADKSGLLWGSAKKIFLLSATINSWDIAELGLDTKRVCYLNCPSPIPSENRPVVREYVTNVSYKNLREATSEIAQVIQEELLPFHKGEKGVIHATYKQIEILRESLTDERFLFHDRWNKREVFERFRSLPATSGAVLVAAGMYEGIDLPDDLGRWQAITKVPWKSLASPAIAYKAKMHTEWYKWQTLKDLIQASGRASRHENDYSVTYLLDGSVSRLIDEDSGLLPEWFRLCLR